MKRFKNKNRKNKARFFVYFLLIVTSFNATLKLLLNKYESDNEFLLGALLDETINNKSMFFEMLNAKISDPKEMIYSGLNKTISKDNLSVFSNVEDDDFDYDNASEYIEDPSPSKVVEPLVYIYNSHQTEEYALNSPLDYSVKPNVMIASYILRENLNNAGINSLVETANIKDYLQKNKLKYSYSYVASKHFLTEALKKYPSIKYLIDIHRDSANIDKTLYEQGGKKYARILFVVGLDHDNYAPNLALAQKLNEMIKEKYPGISRGISKKTGSGVNGIYNQDMSENAMLIEIGGVDNEIEEVYNTVNAISETLINYISGDDNES